MFLCRTCSHTAFAIDVMEEGKDLAAEKEGSRGRHCAAINMCWCHAHHTVARLSQDKNRPWSPGQARSDQARPDSISDHGWLTRPDKIRSEAKISKPNHLDHFEGPIAGVLRGASGAEA